MMAPVKRFVRNNEATLVAILFVGAIICAVAWADGDGERVTSKATDKYDQVYFYTEAADPATLDCVVVELKESASRVDVSEALAVASELALEGCVTMRWVS